MTLQIVKIGGNIVDDPARLGALARDLAAMPGHKILVHGGGKEASRMQRDLGQEPVMVAGRRVTDLDTLRTVTMVYAGLINKRIVALLQAFGCNAIGLTGADANTIPATRRSPIPTDYGYVGDIDPSQVGTEAIGALLSAGLTPVFCAICHDGEGTLLNCNADSVAAALASALAPLYDVTLTYCFEKPGVMRDVNDNASVIPLVTEQSFEQLKAEGIVADGMLPKITNALASARAGVSQVRICMAENLPNHIGTVIRLR